MRDQLYYVFIKICLSWFLAIDTTAETFQFVIFQANCNENVPISQNAVDMRHEDR